MSVTYGFYNSVNGDRKYNAVEMSSIFDGIIKDGVYMAIGDALAVKATTGLGFTIGIGRAWFDHTWTLNDSLYPMSVSTADVLMNRIDAVVLEINANTEARKNEFKIIKGTPASSPKKPSLTKSELVNQYPLAYITVKAGATSITQSNIENAIGTSECPYVTGVIQSMNIDDLVAQWGAEWAEWVDEHTRTFEAWYDQNTESFNEWFNQIKGQLSEDAAGNLQNQVDGKAPINHADGSGNYGLGNQTLYGHVRLSDSAESVDSDVTQGVAATPYAVAQVHLKANTMMPKSGGTFTGTVTAKSQNISGAYVRNIRVQNSSSTSQSTNYIIMVRK